MPEYGIVVTADDKAGSVLKKIGATGKSALAGVRAGAGGAGKAMKALGIAAAIANQALELGKKAMEFFRMAITDTISVALEFRDANDEARKQFEGMQKSADLFRARVGDVLIPLMQGLADAFGPVNDGLVEWINANRILIGTNIINFLETVATTLIKVGTTAVGLVVKAWFGWLEIINLVEAAINKFFVLLLDGVGAALGAMSKLAGFVSDDLAAAFQTAEEFTKGFGAEFQRSTDTAIDRVKELTVSEREAQKAIRDVGLAAETFVGNTAVKMHERLAVSVTGNTERLKEQKVALKETGEAAQEAGSAWDAAATNASSAWGAAAGAIATGQADAAETTKLAAKESAKGVITAAAAAAAAQAAKAMAGIPVVGPFLAVAAAPAMMAFVKGFLTKFDTGGIVGGGSGPVPIMAHAKERVLSVDQTEKFERLVQAMERGGTGGAGGSVNLTIRSDAPPTDVDYEKAARRLGKAQKRLARFGMVGA